MLFNHATFIGVDPSLSRALQDPGGLSRGHLRRAFVYAALNQEQELIAISEGKLEDLLAFAAGQEAALVAVNAPRRPNQGLMRQEEVRQTLVPPPRPGRWLDHRLAEYQMRQHQIGVTPTPSQVEDCPAWMQICFSLYHHLEGLGFQAYPCEGAQRQYLEVHPHACFCALLGQAPFPKDNLEGRLQRQLVLFDQGLKISDPMEFFEEITPRRLLKGTLPLKDIYSSNELDALAAAHTAWMAANHPEQITLLGAVEEGQVVIPVGELKSHY